VLAAALLVVNLAAVHQDMEAHQIQDQIPNGRQQVV